MLRIVGVWGSVGTAPGPFVTHPTSYSWRGGRLQSPLPFHRLMAIIRIRHGRCKHHSGTRPREDGGRVGKIGAERIWSVVICFSSWAMVCRRAGHDNGAGISVVPLLRFSRHLSANASPRLEPYMFDISAAADGGGSAAIQSGLVATAANSVTQWSAKADPRIETQ